MMLSVFDKLRLQTPCEDGSNITQSLKDSDDFERLGLGVVNHDVVRILLNRPESKREIRQILAEVPAKWSFGQESTGLVDGRLNAIGGLYALLGDIAPDFEEIIFRLRSEAVEVHPR